jgi:nucleoside-diphosphate-sugar epimerase
MTNPLAGDLDHILERTEALWEEVRGRRIFITGGTGFFGCWLLESFAWANDRLKLKASALALTRNLDAFKEKAPHLAAHPAIRFHAGDVRSFIFPKGGFSHIVHAATESSAALNEKDPLLMFDTIVDGTRRALEFARTCGAEKILLTSSGAVYGPQPPGITHLPEEQPTASVPPESRSAYGEAKRAAETLCALYSKPHGLNAKIARCFAFVGPYLPLSAHFAVGNFIRDGLAGGPIRVKGDGTPYRSYLYAADLAIWLWTILLRGEPCRPYNTGSEEAVTIGELAHQVARCFQPTARVEIACEPQPGKPPERYVPSVQRCALELGLRPAVDLRESLCRTIRWHQGRAGGVS